MRRWVVLLAFVWSAPANSQTPARDNWFWLSAEVRKEVYKNLVIAVNAEARLNENYQNVRAFFGEAELTYKVNKYLSGSVQYRYGGRENDVSDFVRGQRVTGFLYGRFKYEKFTLTNRLGYFQQYLTLEPGDDRANPETYWRNRLQLKYDLTKKVELLAAAEFFYRTFDDRNRIDEWRYLFGCEVHLNKQHSIKPLFIYSKQVNVRRPDVRNILSVGYYYTLPTKKKEWGQKS
jgi:hypothetical protein